MSNREWLFYVNDMIGFAQKVLTYTDDFDLITFDCRVTL